MTLRACGVQPRDWADPCRVTDLPRYAYHWDRESKLSPPASGKSCSCTKVVCRDRKLYLNHIFNPRLINTMCRLRKVGLGFVGREVVQATSAASESHKGSGGAHTASRPTEISTCLMVALDT